MDRSVCNIRLPHARADRPAIAFGLTTTGTKATTTT